MKNTGRNNKLIPFALLFMTHIVWIEPFYFTLQAAETAFIVLLCPYIIYLLYKGFLDRENKNILCGFILLIFIISIYQGVVTLFCCGVFGCFILLQENSDHEPKVYGLLCLQLFLTLIAALLAYFLLDKILVEIIFKTEKSEYLDNMNHWGSEPASKNILNILMTDYFLTIGNIPAVQAIVEPVMARFARTVCKRLKLFPMLPIYWGIYCCYLPRFFSCTDNFNSGKKDSRKKACIICSCRYRYSIVYYCVINSGWEYAACAFILRFAFCGSIYAILSNWKI
jgi:hypothetical protein